MLQGTQTIIVLSVEPLSIHNSLYYDITYRQSDSEATGKLRINPEAFYADPQPGDQVEVNFLMGNILGARKIG